MDVILLLSTTINPSNPSLTSPIVIALLIHNETAKMQLQSRKCSRKDHHYLRCSQPGIQESVVIHHVHSIIESLQLAQQKQPQLQKETAFDPILQQL